MSFDKNLLSNDLIDLVGTENVIYDDRELRNYGLDQFGNEHIPLMVVKPSSLLHFKRLNFILRQYKIDSITPRGKGLGINLGAYSEDLIIDLTLLNKKLKIDTQKLIITAQAGFNYKEIQKKLQDQGFRLPIEPIFNGTLGGFIASGGYGYGSYRYGTVINIIRNATVILSNGRIIQTGISSVPAYSSGYNLNGLICGSEGFLGIILDSTLEIIPTAPYSLNILLSLSNTDIMEKLKKLTKFPTLYNLSLYRAILNDNSDSIKVLIRLEGFQQSVEQDHSLIKNITGMNFIDSTEADNLWKNRIKKPSQIPATSSILETILPIKELLQFSNFLEEYDSPRYLGILLNASSLLLHIFLSRNLSNSRKNDLLTEFSQKTGKFQARAPTIGNNNKKFVINSHPNLKLLKQIKSIFDEPNRMKSRKLDF